MRTWTPNLISGLRILLIPVWLYFAHRHRAEVLAGSDDDTLRWVCLGILLALGISDVLDGWIARRFDATSDLGAMLDAVADKLAQVVMYTYLALFGGPAFFPVPLWFLAVLLLRDLLLAIGYVVVRRRRGAVKTEHQLHGRLASLLLFVILVLVNAGAGVEIMPEVFAAVGLVVGVSTALYLEDGWAQLKEEPRADLDDRPPAR